MERKIKVLDEKTVKSKGGTCLSDAFAQAANEIHRLDILDGEDVYSRMKLLGKQRSCLRGLENAVNDINRGRLDTQTYIRLKSRRKDPLGVIKEQIEKGNRVIIHVDYDDWEESIEKEEAPIKGILERFRDFNRFGNHSVLVKGIDRGADGETRFIVEDINRERNISIPQDIIKENSSIGPIVIVSKTKGP